MGAPARPCARGREDHAQDEPNLVKNGRDPSAQRVRGGRCSNGSCSGNPGPFELVQKMISFTCLSDRASGSVRTRRYAKIRSKTDEIRARSVRGARRSDGSCSGNPGSFELVQKMISFTCSSGRASGSARAQRYAKIWSQTDQEKAHDASVALRGALVASSSRNSYPLELTLL